LRIEWVEWIDYYSDRESTTRTPERWAEALKHPYLMRIVGFILKEDDDKLLIAFLERADEDLHRLAGKRERAPAAKRGKPSGRTPAPGA